MSKIRNLRQKMNHKESRDTSKQSVCLLEVLHSRKIVTKKGPRMELMLLNRSLFDKSNLSN